MSKDSYEGGYDDVLNLQARGVYSQAMRYNGSAPCPGCGLVMNPIEALSNKGKCLQCVTQLKVNRARSKMV